MHALALLSMIQAVAVPSGGAAAGPGEGAATAGETGQPGSFAEALAGLMALAGQAQPAVAAASPVGTPAEGAATVPQATSAAGLAAAPVQASLALELAQAGTVTGSAEAPTSATTGAVPAAADTAPPAAATADAPSSSRPASATTAEGVAVPAGADFASDETAPAVTSIQRAAGRAASAAGDAEPPRATPATPPAPGAAEDPGRAARATPATPSSHASARAAATPSRVAAGPQAEQPSTPPATPAVVTPSGEAEAAAAAGTTSRRATPAVPADGASGQAASAAPARAAQPSGAASEAALLAASRTQPPAGPAAVTPVQISEAPVAAPLADAALQTQLLDQDPALQAPSPALTALVGDVQDVEPAAALKKAEGGQLALAAEDAATPTARGMATPGQSDAGGSQQGSGEGKHGAAEFHKAEAHQAAAPLEADGAPEPAFELLAGETAIRLEGTADARPAGAGRATSETVTNLAAQMARRMEGRNTRFELALDPAGLGSVQVSVEINPRGELTAHLTFERGDAAAELRSRAAELQRALEQAGFDLSKGGLSFEHGPSGRGHERSAEQRQHGHGRAFAQALETADAADALPAGPVRLNRARSGVDLTV